MPGTGLACSEEACERLYEPASCLPLGVMQAITWLYHAGPVVYLFHADL